MAVQQVFTGNIKYGDVSLTKGLAVHSPEFDKEFYYDGKDLGLTLRKETTTFKLWAPTSSEAWVVLYRNYDSKDETLYEMTRQENGVWVYEHSTNLEGTYYTFRVNIEGTINEAVDPYAKAVGVNGDRGYIVDMSKTNPENWAQDVKPTFVQPTDAIFYEVHVRDFSSHPESGIQNKGKFLAFTEEGTKGPNGIPTGIDHIKSLGVTHVQLLPIYDYSTDSVDETRLEEEQYNWGYDPKNYNAVEGSYSTNPFDPVCRIKELKMAIQSMHKNGLRVIMDVVYNHVFDAYRMSFMKLVPGYYYRYNEDGTLANGSGCGNDTASDRLMMRKFMVESIVHWAREYGFDGFRFDLMGLHDVETMNEIRRALDEIDPTIMMIGEGWVLNTPLQEGEKANQLNAAKMPNIAHFNDGIRDALKGHALFEEETGFVNGGKDRENQLKAGIVGGIHYTNDIKGFAEEPNQTVSYAEAHDNHTIWDKLALHIDENKHEDLLKGMHRLCSSVVLTSQGISFIHAGQEFMRTKQGVENSYKSPTPINWLDWNRASEYYDEVLYLEELISLRKEHAAFRMKSADDIRKHLKFERAPKNVVAYTLRGYANDDVSRNIYVVHNGNQGSRYLRIPRSTTWEVEFGDHHIYHLGYETIEVSGLSTVVLTTDERLK